MSFGENLKNLLLQAPIKNKVVLGFDPGYRTGCKLAVVDGNSRVLFTGVIYPTPPQSTTAIAGVSSDKRPRKYSIIILSFQVFVGTKIVNFGENIGRSIKKRGKVI